MSPRPNIANALLSVRLEVKREVKEGRREINSYHEREEEEEEGEEGKQHKA